jgi:hypothetical protein
VSYNICGLNKLESNSVTREWLLGHDIIALQETLHLPHGLGFEGFTVIDEPSRVQHGGAVGRRSGGIAFLFDNEWLGSAKIEVLFRDWFILGVKVTFGEEDFLFVNIYVPLHTEERPQHLDTVIQSRLDTLLNQYGGPRAVLCGDWNGDLFRLNPGFDRKFLKISNRLQTMGFSREPANRRPFTFRQKNRRSTIDYIFHRGLVNVDFSIARIFLTNHRPIRLNFEVPRTSSSLHLDPSRGRAYPRSKNSLDKLEKEINGLLLMKVIAHARLLGF